MSSIITIRPCRPDDAETLAELVRELAVYEQLEAFARATPDDFRTHLFGPRPVAEAIMAEVEGVPGAVGFALFFMTFSTFRGQPGLYLEDLFVRAGASAAGDRQGTAGDAWPGSPSTAAAAGWSGRCSTGTPRRSAFTDAIGAQPLDEWTVFRIDDEPLERLARHAPPALRRGFDAVWFPVNPRDPPDEPLFPAPHRTDGRLRAGRAAARRRVRQAQHQRESLSAFAPGRRGDRSRPWAIGSGAIPTRWATAFREAAAGCMGCRPTGSCRATAPTTC